MENLTMLPAWLENAPFWKFWGVIITISILPLSSLLSSISKNSSDRMKSSREDVKSIDERYKELIERGDLTYDSLVEAFKFMSKNLQDLQIELERTKKNLRTEIEVLEKDRDNGWNLGRGMDKKCHFYWHICVNLSQDFNSLYLWSKKLVDGLISMERFSSIILTMSEKPPIAAPPDLMNVEPTPPPTPATTS